MKRTAVRDIVALFAASRVGFMMITYFGYILLVLPRYSNIPAGLNVLVDSWDRWDAVNYIRIAQYGYLSQNHPFDPAFFPLFPFLIRGAAWLVGKQGYVIVGMVISNLAFLGAMFIIYEIAADMLGEQVGRRTLLYLSLFPTAFYFFAAYTESLFLLCTAGCFLALRRRRWLIAGVCGLFAALTRNAGILLVIPYLYEVWLSREDTSWRLTAILAEFKPLLLRLLPIVLIPLGLAIYIYYCWRIAGDPLRFASAQDHWGRHSTWPFAGVWGNLVEIFWQQPFTSSNTAHDLLDLGATLGFITLAIAGWRKLRTSYTLWLVLLLFTALIAPATSALADPLQSNQRFVLVMFPAYITLGALGVKYPRLHQAFMVGFPLLLAVLSLVFVMNRWLV